MHLFINKGDATRWAFKLHLHRIILIFLYSHLRIIRCTCVAGWAQTVIGVSIVLQSKSQQELSQSVTSHKFHAFAYVTLDINVSVVIAHTHVDFVVLIIYTVQFFMLKISWLCCVGVANRCVYFYLSVFPLFASYLFCLPTHVLDIVECARTWQTPKYPRKILHGIFYLINSLFIEKKRI